MDTAATADRMAEDQVIRRVYRRLMWFLLALFIVSFLDRINMSFGALSMNRDLGLSSTMFGMANSAFYIAYLVAEIPSNMIMVRVGARLWIPRIMITWGIASIGTMFAVGPLSLYGLRALVGLAEAGFMPGILLYITFWFPPAYRARAVSLFIMAQPITIGFGSTLSGMILDLNNTFGLAGWKWLFLLEGLPSVVLGVAAYFVLSDGPASARWLSASEKQALARTLERETVQVADDAGTGSVWREVFTAPVMLLAVAYFGLVNTLSANSTWVPQIVRAALPHGSFTTIGLVTAIPPLVTVALMPLWGARSDRRQERTWHLVLPMGLAAFGWFVIIGVDNAWLRLLGLIGVSVGTFAAQGVFWTMPPRYLSRRARPVGMAVVNTLGLLGSAIGPSIIGVLKDATGSFTAGLLFVIATVVIGMVCVLIIPRLSGRARPVAVQGSL